jgi:AcrR family transcriptional regulator
MATVAPPGLTAKGIATRERIVAAAADHVLAHGSAGTSLDAIGAATRTSRSQLFHYFPEGKAELVRAVVALQGARVLDAQRPELDHLDTWASWKRWRDAVVAHYTANDGRHGCPIGSLAGEAAASDPQLRADIAAYFDTWHSLLRDGIARMKAAALLRRSADPDALATAMLAAIQGGLVLAQASGDLRPLGDALDAALAGLRSYAA